MNPALVVDGQELKLGRRVPSVADLPQHWPEMLAHQYPLAGSGSSSSGGLRSGAAPIAAGAS